MSDQPYEKPSPTDTPVSKMNPEQIKDAAERILEQQSPEVQEAVHKGQSFYRQNRPIILTGVALFAVMKVNKRMVKKATVKAVAKAIAKNDGRVSSALDSVDYPNLFDILESLRETPGMAYIPHGGGMVHLLKGRDAIVTVFGDFDRMNTEELWNQVANILNLNVRT